MHFGPNARPTSIIRIGVEDGEETVWHRVCFFGDTAERAHRLIYKGRELLVTATIRYRDITANGTKYRVADLIGQDFDAFGPPRSADDYPAAATYNAMVDPAIPF